ncbi:MAG TPA: hypothetical protein VFN89_02650 [Solirubrobacterales bacterium]|nr:hypothetical protein [Solirubrobacterales bacterium]
MTTIQSPVGSGVIGQADTTKSWWQQIQRYIVPIATLGNMGDSRKVDLSGF